MSQEVFSFLWGNPDAPFGANGEPLRDCIRLIQRAKFKKYPVDLTLNVAEVAWD